MKKKSIFITLLITIVALSGLFSVSASEGQPPEPGDFPRDSDMPVTQNLRWNSGESSERFTSTGDGAVSLEQFSSTQYPGNRSLKPAIPVGDPGLSYRYVDPFGIVESGYVADNSHLNTPRGLAIDGSNNIYVVEYKGSRALKYNSSATHQFSIGVAGLHYVEEGKDIFDFPRDVAVDSGGNFWVADSNRVTQYDSSGNFLQVFPDWDDGPWRCRDDNGHFCGARGVEFDSTGKMYVGDSWNYRVQVFTFSGGSPVYHSTIGETGVQGSDNSHFSRPEQLVVDSSNNLYIADTNNYRIQKCAYTTSWSCSTFHGTGSWGSGANELGYVDGLGIDSGNNIYIADSDNGRIKKCTSGGSCSTVITGLYWPTDVVIDSSGNIFVSDWDYAAILKYNNSGTFQNYFAGTPNVPYVTDTTRMFYPWGITVADDGSIYIAEYLGNRLIKLDENGNQQWVVGTPGVGGSSNDRLNWPQGNLAIDSSGRIYVPDTERHRVQIFTSSGTYFGTMGVTGQRGSDNSHFDRPMGVAISPLNGDIYVADHENTRVQIFHSNLSYKATLGTSDVWGTGDYEFDGPTGVAVDSSGNIYVADKYNQRIQKFNSSRVYQSTIGTTDVCDWSFDYLCGPSSVVVDNHNHLLVTEQWDNRVQVYDTDGNYLTSIGGDWGTNTGSFRNPYGIAVDNNGAVYVTDSTNHRIQKYSPGVPGWLQSNINGFGTPYNYGIRSLESFNDELYAGTSNWDYGADIWKMDGSGSWSSVMTGGFGKIANGGIAGLIDYNGKLYAGTSSDETNGGEIWRSDNGLSWTNVVSSGFGDPTNGEVWVFEIFKDMLYAGTWSYTNSHGTEIWRSNTGNAGSWTRVVQNGFNMDTYNTGVQTFAVYDNYLYAGTGNFNTGGEVWRTSDGTSWSQVNTNGFGDQYNRRIVLEPFGSYLYAGTYNYSNSDNPGCELWRCQVCDGSDWTQIPIAKGFGDTQNRWIQAMTVYKNMLYAFTMNYSNGVEAWYSVDGLNWNQGNPDGFGDSSNAYVIDDGALEYNDMLYLGTTNWAHGGEIWMIPELIYLPLISR